MRTTLNLDDDVSASMTARARNEGRSLSRIANELLRAGLRAAQVGEPLARYEPPVFDTGRALLDVTDVAGALEILERD
ncbi:MAG: CopG family transcriptional regulator [Actinobacteria bacterium]|nr:CopG family transcriptional regulator [Actinomycetota bacterium]